MLKKLEDLILYRDRRFYAAFPAVTTLDDGTVYLLFRRARDQRRLISPTAADDDPLLDRVDHIDPRSQLTALRFSAGLDALGGPEVLPADPEAADQDANLLKLADGTLLVTSFSWYPFAHRYADRIVRDGGSFAGQRDETGSLFLFWGAFSLLSGDNGRTWSERTSLAALPGHRDILPGQRRLYGGALRGRPLQRTDGTILQATYMSRGSRQSTIAAPNADSHLHASTDGGANWSYVGTIAADSAGPVHMLEPSLYETPTGRLIAFHRSAGAKDALLTATSDDGGRNWSAWRRHDVTGHPFDVQRLPDGRALLVYGYRHKPYGIRARLLDAECKDIDSAEEFVIRDDGPSPDLGYPWATVLPGGDLLVVYYFCDESGVRHIAGSRLAVTA